MGDEHEVIRRDFLLDDLKEVCDESRIDGTVVVQARQIVEESEWLLSLADQSELIRGVVGWVPLMENAGEPFLERFAAHSKLKGVRHVVHDEPDDDFILGADFNRGIESLAKYDLVYDVLIFWKHLQQTIRFVDQHPQQAFVVDHIAKPRIIGGEYDRDWDRGIRELAKREHVSCKISGMLTEVRDEAWSLDQLQPYFDAIFEAFGPQRVMYGSDWPVCLLREPYAKWAKTAGQLSASLSEDEQAAFWGGNAARIYGL